jgi:hypothetical protein
MPTINTSQHEDVMVKIGEMLASVKENDQPQYEIILEYLGLIFKQFNSGKNLHIERKLYDMIDAEIKSTALRDKDLT